MPKRPTVHLCGTPSDKCQGTFIAVNHIMGDGNKAHASSLEAFRCTAAHLVRDLGFTQIAPREFRPAPQVDGPECECTCGAKKKDHAPADHPFEVGVRPIRILTKKSRFGARMRNGKEGTRNMPVKMAGNRHGGNVASV